jgi:hypothetical protein
MAKLFRIKAYHGASNEAYRDDDWKLIFDLFLDDESIPCGIVETFGYEEISVLEYNRRDLMIIKPDMSVLSQEIGSYKGEVVIANHKHYIRFHRPLSVGSEFEYSVDDVYVFTIREIKPLLAETIPPS